MRFTFQKLSGPIYPAYLVVGDYSIALEAELIETLQTTVSKENSQFLEDIVRIVGVNRYLSEMIRKKIDSTENKHALILNLRNSLKNL